MDEFTINNNKLYVNGIEMLSRLLMILKCNFSSLVISCDCGGSSQLTCWTHSQLVAMFISGN